MTSGRNRMPRGRVKDNPYLYALDDLNDATLHRSIYGQSTARDMRPTNPDLSSGTANTRTEASALNGGFHFPNATVDMRQNTPRITKTPSFERSIENQVC